MEETKTKIAEPVGTSKEDCQDKPQENFPGCFISPFMKRLKSFDDYKPSQDAIDSVTKGLLPKSETPPKSES